MPESQAPSVEEVTIQVDKLDLEKKPKVRKQQTAEEFEAQKAQFVATGPRLNTSNWLYDPQTLAQLNPLQKTDRVHILHACEKAYFQRDYEKCLELILTGERLFGVELEDETANSDIKREFASLGRKTKKSSKVERHVVELLHIKEACLRKMAPDAAS